MAKKGQQDVSPLKQDTGKAVSRGGRPALISRERILDVARQIPAAELTMPAVASRLGVSPMSVYRHFETRNTLLIALGAQIAGDFRLRPADPQGWREWLVDSALALYTFLIDNPVILAAPSWVHVAGMGQPLLEAAHDTLEGAGFDVVEASEAWAVVSGHAYLRARLLHDATSHGDPEILRAAVNSMQSKSEKAAARERAFIEARGTTDARELLAHSLRWLVSNLPEPSGGAARDSGAASTLGSARDQRRKA